MNTVNIDGKIVSFTSERNVLEVTRKAGIDIPTFCYHSELSVYGACRMCLVDIEGMGIVTSCTTIPVHGMIVKTNTAKIREIRRINLELILASHERECTTCGKSGSCTLQSLSQKMGIDTIRYASKPRKCDIDASSHAVTRDPNKCVLCGDCVRVCDEIQGIGAIDFAYRGSSASVVPAFGKNLASVDCVNCGQCVRVCPTGALMSQEEIKDVWNDLDNPAYVSIAQVAPAIRVALGEHFGFKPGEITTGKLITALRRIGFNKIYDTAFAADMTVVEEATEFLKRVKTNGKLPLITSCCPAWVTYAEQNYVDLLPHLSTCRSPQQMFGSYAKHILPGLLNIDREQLKVVSIMPCTAKKFEAKRSEFSQNGIQDIDHVLTTRELARMIQAAGIRFSEIEESSFDMPFGLTSGSGVLFGSSGGVTEAVVRYVYETVERKHYCDNLYQNTSNNTAVREFGITVSGTQFTIAVVQGLATAKKICDEIRNGTSPYHLVEVMACPGGCINGGGQPVSWDHNTIELRKNGLRSVDRCTPVHSAHENMTLSEAYKTSLGHAGGEMAHQLLHTHYKSQKRIRDEEFDLTQSTIKPSVTVEVCLGTNCCLHGAHELLKKTMSYIEKNELSHQVAVRGAFCFEKCGKSPNVMIENTVIEKCTFEKIVHTIQTSLKASV